MPVVVAASDVDQFTVLSAKHLTTRDWPRDLVPPVALTHIEDAVDRITVAPLIKDVPLVERKLGEGGNPRDVAGPGPGMRAVTILTQNVSSGVAGLIRPGDKVDVHLTVTSMASRDFPGGASSTLLLQNVKVLAVNQQVDLKTENKVDANLLRSVTLLVTPEQAVKLTLGQNKGTLHLALRNPEDRDPVKTRPITLAELGFSGSTSRRATVPHLAPVELPPPQLLRTHTLSRYSAAGRGPAVDDPGQGMK